MPSWVCSTREGEPTPCGFRRPLGTEPCPHCGNTTSYTDWENDPDPPTTPPTREETTG